MKEMINKFTVPRSPTSSTILKKQTSRKYLTLESQSSGGKFSSLMITCCSKDQTWKMDERGVKLFSNINQAFIKDPEIDEYDFIPVVEPQNNCNPIVLENHKLGVELWATRLLFNYAYTELMNSVKSRQNLKMTDTDLQIQLSRSVLLVNADNATAWNIRKCLVRDEILPVKEDLRCSALILTKHPKSPETFAHRKWLFMQLQKNKSTKEVVETIGHSALSNRVTSHLHHDFLTGKERSSEAQNNSKPLIAEMQEYVLKELEVCSNAAAKYPNNYNAWSHRIWLIRNICHSNEEVLNSEIRYTSSWMARNKSDYSGYHYRQFILHTRYNLNEVTHNHCCEICDILVREINQVGSDIRDFPGHETLWCHRRFAVQMLLQHLTRSTVKTIQKGTYHPVNCEIAPKKSRLDLASSSEENDQDTLLTHEHILQNERYFTNSIQLEGEKVKFKLEWQTTLGDKYLQWLDRIGHSSHPS